MGCAPRALARRSGNDSPRDGFLKESGVGLGFKGLSLGFVGCFGKSGL